MVFEKISICKGKCSNLNVKKIGIFRIKQMLEENAYEPKFLEEFGINFI